MRDAFWLFRQGEWLQSQSADFSISLKKSDNIKEYQMAQASKDYGRIFMDVCLRRVESV